MASSLTLTEILPADLPASAPTGKQILFLSSENGVAYVRDDNGNDLSMTSVNEQANTIYINKASDFPVAVAGVIELDPGYDATYVIGVTTIDLGTDVLSISGGSAIHIIGLHPQESQLVTNSSSPLISIVNSSLDHEKLIMSNSGGDIYAVSGDGSNFIVGTRIIIFNCENIGLNISGLTSFAFFRSSFVMTRTGGISFSGNNSQIVLNDLSGGLISGFAGFTGTLIDLQSSTFDILRMDSGRIFPAAGTTFLTGAAGGANINAGGSAEMSGTIFKGAGSSVSVITGQDDNWLFSGNAFNDGVRNTRSATDSYLSSSQTVTISAVNTFVPIAGSNWASGLGAHFTVNSAGLATYTGVTDIDVVIIGTASIEKVGGGSDVLCMRIAINGTTVTASD